MERFEVTLVECVTPQFTVLIFILPMHLINANRWRNFEDEILKASVMKFGTNQWSRTASLLPGRNARACRERWFAFHDPHMKRGEWARSEQEKLIRLHQSLPSQWKTIAGILARPVHECVRQYESLAGDDGERKSELDELEDTVHFLEPIPDAIDMDEVHRETLNEARMRLANTRGKKAKRKIRLKALEVAKRLGKMHKRREFRAAGLGGERRIQSGEIDWNTDIAFEREVPQRQFYVQVEGEQGKVSDEREQLERFVGMTIAELRGKTKDQKTLEQRRATLRRKLEHKKRDLPGFIQIQNERRKREREASLKLLRSGRGLDDGEEDGMMIGLPGSSVSEGDIAWAQDHADFRALERIAREQRHEDGVSRSSQIRQVAKFLRKRDREANPLDVLHKDEEIVLDDQPIPSETVRQFFRQGRAAEKEIAGKKVEVKDEAQVEIVENTVGAVEGIEDALTSIPLPQKSSYNIFVEAAETDGGEETGSFHVLVEKDEEVVAAKRKKKLKRVRKQAELDMLYALRSTCASVGLSRPTVESVSESLVFVKDPVIRCIGEGLKCMLEREKQVFCDDRVLSEAGGVALRKGITAKDGVAILCDGKDPKKVLESWRKAEQYVERCRQACDVEDECDVCEFKVDEVLVEELCERREELINELDNRVKHEIGNCNDDYTEYFDIIRGLEVECENLERKLQQCRAVREFEWEAAGQNLKKREKILARLVAEHAVLQRYYAEIVT